MEVSVNQSVTGPAVREENITFNFSTSKIDEQKETLIPEGAIASVTQNYAFYQPGPYNPSGMLNGVRFEDTGPESTIIGINRTLIHADESRKTPKAKTLGVAGLMALLNRTSIPIRFGSSLIAGPAPFVPAPRDLAKKRLEVTVSGEHSTARRWALYNASPVLFQDNPTILVQNSVHAAARFDAEMMNLRWTISPFLGAMGAVCIVYVGDNASIINGVNMLTGRLHEHLTRIQIPHAFVPRNGALELDVITFDPRNEDYSKAVQEYVLLGAECAKYATMGGSLADFVVKATQLFADYQQIMLHRFVGQAWNYAERGQLFYTGFKL